MRNALHCRNVHVNGRRTSMRMEPMLWEMVEDVAAREGLDINALLSRIETKVRPQAGTELNLTATVRLFIMEYFRAAATEDGHRQAGHGLGDPLAGVALHPRAPERGDRRRPRGLGRDHRTGISADPSAP